MFRATLLLGILPTVFGIYHCPITHPWVYTDGEGNDNCCATAGDSDGNANIHYSNPKTSQTCEGNDSVPCKVRDYWQTCTSYDFGDTCPSTNPWAYRPAANLDYCCANSTDSSNYQNSNSGPYDWRFNNCKNNAYTQCADPPCSDWGKLEGYLGCYIDNATRDMPFQIGGSQQVSGLTHCKAIAKQEGYKYYALQYEAECFMGNEYGSQGIAEDSECKTLSIDHKTFAGGVYRNSVYSTEAPQLVTCKGTYDDQVIGIYADGVRLPIKGSYSIWNGIWEVQFLDTTQRLSIRGWDGQQYGINSGGLAFSCTSENEDSKWHGLYSHPRFVHYVRGYSTNSSEASDPPFRYMDAAYDLDSAPADFQFKPVSQLGPHRDHMVGHFSADVHVLSAGFGHYQTFVIEPPSVDNYPERSSSYQCELSTTHSYGPANQCCDGYYGRMGADAQGCHSGTSVQGKTNPWIQIDLGSEKFVHGLYIVNRNNSSGGAGIRERLGEHEVYVGNDPSYLNNDLCGTATADGSTYASFVRCFGESRGRYVTLVLPGTGRILNLDEVIPYTTSGDHITSTYDYVNPNASFFSKEFYLKDDKFIFTADVTPNGIGTEEALLLSRGNAGEGLTILSLKAGINVLQLMGQDTGKILETGTTYNIQVRRVVHDSGDVVALYVDGVYVAEQAVSFNDNESSTTAEGGAYNHNGKAPWAVGAGLYTAESKGTIQTTLQENRVYSACWANDCAGIHGESMLNSSHSWATSNNSNSSNDSVTLDLLSGKTVVGFAVQARKEDVGQSVREFEGYYSNDNITFQQIRTQNNGHGNIMGSPPTINTASTQSERDAITQTYVFPVEARYVKIIPKVCGGHCSMRVDVIAIDELNYNDRNFKAFNGSINNTQFQVLAEEATRAPTGSPTAHPTIAEGNVVCGSANEIVFNTFYHTVGGSYHVNLDSQVNGVDFSVSGPEGVNIALLNSSVTPDASTITQGFTGGYDIYLGARDEPFAHISGIFGGTPEAVVHLHDDDIVHESESRDYSITVDGSVVTIWKGHSHSSLKVALLSHDFGSAKTVDYAVFAYGYGDLECQES